MSSIEKVTFPNVDGDLLSARIDRPDGEARAYALLAHCFTCNKSLRAAGHIATALVAQGIAVFRFDFTGLGESAGDFSDTNFSTNVLDLVQAAHFMSEQGYAPQLLVGHSLGGTAVLKAARSLDSVQAVVTIGSPFTAAHVVSQFSEYKQMIAEKGEAFVQLAGREFKIKQQFMDDLEAVSIAEDIPQLKKALLVMHAPLDATVDISNAAKIFQVARHPKSYLSLDQSDHLLSQTSDASYVGHLMAAWVGRYLE